MSREEGAKGTILGGFRIAHGAQARCLFSFVRLPSCLFFLGLNLSLTSFFNSTISFPPLESAPGPFFTEGRKNKVFTTARLPRPYRSESLNFRATRACFSPLPQLVLAEPCSQTSWKLNHRTPARKQETVTAKKPGLLSKGLASALWKGERGKPSRAPKDVEDMAGSRSRALKGAGASSLDGAAILCYSTQPSTAAAPLSEPSVHLICSLRETPSPRLGPDRGAPSGASPVPGNIFPSSD